MNRFFSVHRIAAALVACGILGLALPASAGGERPLKGWAEEALTGFEVTPDGLQLTADGFGEATHLGWFTRHAVAILQDGILAGTVTFVAANGDKLCADLDGAFTSDTTIEGTYTITGGTGRFANASGAADFSAVMADGIITLEFKGSITY